MDNHLVDPFPIGAMIVDNFLILFQRQRQGDPLILAYNTGLCFGTISLRHGGWALNEFSAFHASLFSKPQIPAESGVFTSLPLVGNHQFKVFLNS
jgi:hypothetical protein